MNNMQMMSYNLKDTKVYSNDDFMLVLESHGLPNSAPYVRKLEALNIIPSPRLPTSTNVKSAKVYTGKQIKMIIKKILDYIEGDSIMVPTKNSV